MQELIEMDSTPQTSHLSPISHPSPGGTSSSFIKTKSSPPSSSSTSASMRTPILAEKVLRKEFELRAVSDRSISYSWVFLPVLCYLATLVGGIMTCIGVGNTFAAFDYYCLFNANFTLKIKSNPSGVRNSTLEEFQINSWGNKNDCLFSEYGSVALALFSGVWIVMVLQCGRGGASRRGFRLPDAWRIIPPTCVGNTIIFIMACFILSSVSTGWESFCENSLFTIDDHSVTIDKSNLSCSDILGFTYKPKGVNLMSYIEHIDLLKQSRIAQIGATIQFFGCLLGFLIVILRCCTGPDFDLYVRRDVAYLPANTEEDDEEAGAGECRRILEEDDDDDYFDANSTPAELKPIQVRNPETATVICHQAPSSNDEDGDENSSLKSTTGLILN